VQIQSVLTSTAKPENSLYSCSPQPQVLIKPCFIIIRMGIMKYFLSCGYLFQGVRKERFKQDQERYEPRMNSCYGDWIQSQDPPRHNADNGYESSNENGCPRQ
jgi:hypothetical protein